jgi:hypothetical protein
MYAEHENDAEARVHRLLRERLAVLDADRHVEAAREAEFARKRVEVFGHHPARHRIDRRFADREREARARDRAHARPREKAHPRLRRQPHAREHDGAVGDVGIVSRVLHGAGFRQIAVARRGPAEDERQRHVLPFRQRDFRALARLAAQQKTRRREARHGRATARRVAASERRGRLGCLVTHGLG